MKLMTLKNLVPVLGLCAGLFAASPSAFASGASGEALRGHLDNYTDMSKVDIIEVAHCTHEGIIFNRSCGSRSAHGLVQEDGSFAIPSLEEYQGWGKSTEWEMALAATTMDHQVYYQPLDFDPKHLDFSHLTLVSLGSQTVTTVLPQVGDTGTGKWHFELYVLARPEGAGTSLGVYSHADTSTVSVIASDVVLLTEALAQKDVFYVQMRATWVSGVGTSTVRAKSTLMAIDGHDRILPQTIEFSIDPQS